MVYVKLYRGHVTHTKEIQNRQIRFATFENCQ